MIPAIITSHSSPLAPHIWDERKRMEEMRLGTVRRCVGSWYLENALTPIVMRDTSVPSTLVSSVACLVCTATMIAAPSWHADNCGKIGACKNSGSRRRGGCVRTMAISATQYRDLVRTAAR